MSDDDKEVFHDPVHIPVSGELDLHMFSPKDAASVVDEYLLECLRLGIYEVKIIHGKGKGILRQTIHSFLKNSPKVRSFTLDNGPSGWGATIAYLKKDITSNS